MGCKWSVSWDILSTGTWPSHLSRHFKLSYKLTLDYFPKISKISRLCYFVCSLFCNITEYAWDVAKYAFIYLGFQAFKYWLYSLRYGTNCFNDYRYTLKILTAIAVPRIPPAKLLVPNKPNTVVLCWSENQLVSDFTQFGQAVD